MGEVKMEFVITRKELCDILGLINSIEDESAKAIAYRQKEKRAHAVVCAHHCCYKLRNIVDGVFRQAKE